MREGHWICAASAAAILLGAAAPAAADDAGSADLRIRARETAAAGQAVRNGLFSAPGGPGRDRRFAPGVYVVATFGLDDGELQALMTDARRAGYPVVLRGVWRGSMPETVVRAKRLAGEHGEHAPAMTIDPPLIRWLGADVAPALVLRGATRACVIAGRRPLGDLIARAAREWPAFRPWAEAAQRLLAKRSDEPGRLDGLRWPGEPPECRERLDPPPIPLAEPDLAEALREAVLKHDWKGEAARARERAVRRIAEGPGLALPRASAAERRTVDLTVEVRERIVDPRTQHVLAEPGTRINPLDRVPFIEELWILDGQDAAQVAWAEARARTAGPARVLLARGDALALMRRWGRPVQWLPPELADRLGLTALPAVVRAKGPVLDVETHVVKDRQDSQN